MNELLATRFAEIALGHVTREYPNNIVHYFNGAEDVGTPRQLHPIFYGSLDWHSCVHSYWLLAWVLKRYPGLDVSERIRALFEAQLDADKVAAELAYFQAPGRESFERPYGWAWCLKLVAELGGDRATEPYHKILAPLGEYLAAAFVDFWPKQTYPIRSGAHANSAFAIVLALDYAETFDDQALLQVLKQSALDWYENDSHCPAWEPGGDEFLSPTLCEALCMQRVLDRETFALWLTRFLPELDDRKPATLFIPATVTDRSDGKIAHLDGLNLSRAWCWRELARGLASDDRRGIAMQESAERHLDAALDHLQSDYMGEHWLATFALLALASEA